MSNGPTGFFDASQHAPRQSIGAHPVGMFDFQITATDVKGTKDNTGGFFEVEFSSPQGSIIHRYNLWNASPKAVEIAYGQLSALCHATGVHRLSWDNNAAGKELRNARGKMLIGYQKGEEPTEEKPQGGYVELKRVFDINGNEPGKAPASAPQPQAAPIQQQPNGGWGNNNPNASAPPPGHVAPVSWGNPAPQQEQAAAPAWSQGQAPKTPPWGNR